MKDAAEVKINGVTDATLLVHPFSVDIRSLLHAGDNEIQVTVVNSLTNYVSMIRWPKSPVSQMGTSRRFRRGCLDLLCWITRL